jgi:hypothetical protein
MVKGTELCDIYNPWSDYECIEQIIILIKNNCKENA